MTTKKQRESACVGAERAPVLKSVYLIAC